ncbi:hypothetical protein [Halocatena halophila]|uniref:hypothetical protein n=1 Tax=Halocatena halophila TaxID=2814576 RepID=UPI002ED41A43
MAVTKSDSFRVFGPEFGKTDSFVDVSVSAIDSKGNIYLSDSSGNEWSRTDSEITKLFDEKLIMASSNVTTNSLWDVLTTLTSERQNTSNNFVDAELKNAQKSIFLAVFEASR